MEQIYTQPNIKQRISEMVRSAAFLIMDELTEEPTPETRPASITYYTTGDLEEPNDGRLAA